MRRMNSSPSGPNNKFIEKWVEKLGCSEWIGEPKLLGQKSKENYKSSLKKSVLGNA